jgi:glutamate transport system ATP-binding protein
MTNETTLPVLSAESIHKRYGATHVLRGVTLNVHKGETVVILGPSGSGKSTLLRTLNRLETIDSGEIRYNGELIPEEGNELAAYRSHVGMVFQSFNLYPHKTVVENLTLAPVKRRLMSKHAAEDRAQQLLSQVNMSEHGLKRPAQLSGGQQQRVAIARALAMNPKVMLFDEPTSALDPEMIQEVLKVMRELGEGGMTSVLVTHEIGFARQSADRIVFIDEGEIIEEGTPLEFFENTKTERARDFLDKIIHH